MRWRLNQRLKLVFDVLKWSFLASTKHLDTWDSWKVEHGKVQWLTAVKMRNVKSKEKEREIQKVQTSSKVEPANLIIGKYQRRTELKWKPKWVAELGERGPLLTLRHEKLRWLLTTALCKVIISSLFSHKTNCPSNQILLLFLKK